MSGTSAHISISDYALVLCVCFTIMWTSEIEFSFPCQSDLLHQLLKFLQTRYSELLKEKLSSYFEISVFPPHSRLSLEVHSGWL